MAAWRQEPGLTVATLRVVSGGAQCTSMVSPYCRPHSVHCCEKKFQAHACNTLAFRALARSATHRHRARGRLHDRENARGHVQPRCRGEGGVGRGKGCRRRHHSAGGPPAWRNAHGQGRHPAAQRTCARRVGRPTRRTDGRVGSTAVRRGASNRTGRWRRQPPTRRRNGSRRAGTITRGSSWALRTPDVAARGRRAQLGAVGGGRGAGAIRAL